MNANLLKYLASYQNVHNIRQTYLLVKYSREKLFRILAEWKKFLPKYVNKLNLTRHDYNDFLYLSFVLSVERLAAWKMCKLSGRYWLFWQKVIRIW